MNICFLLSKILGSRKSPAAATYSITGNIVDAGATPIESVTVNLTGDATDDTTTDASGDYAFTGLSDGTYTVTPSKTGYVFTPTDDEVVISGGDDTSDFVAAAVWAVSGDIVDGTDAGIEGVAVTLSGDATDSTSTDVNGHYEFTGLVDGSYTVTPTLAGYVFTADHEDVTVSGDDVVVDNMVGVQYLILPVYHNWNGETVGTAPSHGTNSADSAATYGGQPYDPFTVDADGVGSWTESISGIPSGGPLAESIAINLGGIIDPNSADLRVVLLAYAVEAQGYIDIALTASAGFTPNVNKIAMRNYENQNPDVHNHSRTIETVSDFSDAYAPGSNNQSGTQWRYYFFKQTKAGESEWSCYSSAGVLVYGITRAYQGTAGVFPNDMGYLSVRGVQGGGIKVAQIWVGSGAWPTLPMSPMSNL